MAIKTNPLMSNETVKLTDIKQGAQVKITNFEGEAHLWKKLNQYGLFPGDVAKVLRFAPFDGPVLLEVGGREIALGKSIAARILVEAALCDLS